jgi:hypothetical protein
LASPGLLLPDRCGISASSEALGGRESASLNSRECPDISHIVMFLKDFLFTHESGMSFAISQRGRAGRAHYKSLQRGGLALS